MSAASEADQAGFGDTGRRRGAVAEAVRSFFVRTLTAEKHAERLGFAAWGGEPCPFFNRLLIVAFRRGQNEWKAWAAAISDGPDA
jgi:hypothetical protein